MFIKVFAIVSSASFTSGCTGSFGACFTSSAKNMVSIRIPSSVGIRVNSFSFVPIKLLQAVINEISNGTFDNVKSADEIIHKVAADKSILSNWS
ncbi:MAG: hypothetical protein ACLUV3_06515 [Oscillospiraceae bacterium]